MEKNIKKIIAKSRKDLKNLKSFTSKFKSVCKYCGKPPSNYFNSRTLTNFKSPRDFDKYWNSLKKYFKFFQKEGFYKAYHDPSSYIDTFSFRYCQVYKSYQSRPHKNLNHNNNTCITEFFSCHCGRTTWAFNRSIFDSRPDITCRKI
jgi:hypothetical protein